MRAAEILQPPAASEMSCFPAAVQNTTRLVKGNGPNQHRSPMLHTQFPCMGDQPVSLTGFFSMRQGEESNHQEEDEDLKDPQQLIGMFLDLFLTYVW